MPDRKFQTVWLPSYAELDLPEAIDPDHLPAGERRMLLDKDVMEFVEDLYRPASQTKPAKKGAKKQH